MNAPAPRIPEAGELLAGKYRLIAVLGRGGMGVVFDGHHELLDRRVAIKVLAPEVLGSAEAVTRFLNEARAAARISSDRVVQVLDVGLLDGGLPFMVMERLEGVDLAKLAEQQGSLQVSDVVDLLMEGIEGVAHAHLEGVIHRDLKPSNLFLARRSDRTSSVKVLDFGISKITASGASSGSGSMTSTRAVLGSPLYMSPEQLRSAKTIDVRADIWSLGVIAYELLSGKVPFDGDNIVEIFAAIQERDARPLTESRPDVPPRLDDVIRRCLRRAKEDRFPNVFVLAQELAPFGTARGQAAMARLEAHVSSKGLSFDEARAARPRLPSAEPAPGAVNRDSRAAGAVTPPTVSPTPVPNGAGSGSSEGLPPKPRVATAAPWSSTGGASVRPKAPVTIALIAAASIVMTLVLVGATTLLRSKLAANHEGLTSAEAGLGAAPQPALSVRSLSSSEPPTATFVSSPGPALATDVGGADAAAAPPADDKPKHGRTKIHTPPTSTATTHPQPPPPPTPPASPAAGSTNPLTMKPM